MKTFWLLYGNILLEILKILYDTYQRLFQSMQHYHCKGANTIILSAFQFLGYWADFFPFQQTWAENVSKHDSTSYPEYSKTWH